MAEKSLSEGLVIDFPALLSSLFLPPTKYKPVSQFASARIFMKQCVKTLGEHSMLDQYIQRRSVLEQSMAWWLRCKLVGIQMPAFLSNL